MSHYVLSLRAGVTASNVRQLERAEEAGTIQLRSLERIADALNCRLCYVLAPREPLQHMARRQALDKAARVVAARTQQLDLTGHDPALLAAAIAIEVESLADELVNRRDLWSTDRLGGAPVRSEGS